MKTSNFLFIIIAVLMAIILLQRSTYLPRVAPKPKIDTVLVPIPIHDTVPGKPKLIKIKGDIQWRDSVQFKADTNYARLLRQYDSLGDLYFSQHIYKTDFKVGTYGTASVLDTIVSNVITGNSLLFNVTIPEKIVTITQPAPAVRQLYVGGGIGGNPVTPVSYGHVGLLYKDRQDRIFGASVGYNGQVIYTISSYWKIKF